MSGIIWSDEMFSVGIRKIDDQHKQLINLINILDSQRNKNEPWFTEKVLGTLVDYTKNHFSDEEKLLKKIQFPAFENHHQRHQEFIESVEKFRTSFTAKGPTPETIDELSSFLSDWLKHHIMVEDKAYCFYLEL